MDYWFGHIGFVIQLNDIIPFIKSLPNIKSEKILALAKIGLEVKTLK